MCPRSEPKMSHWLLTLSLGTLMHWPWVWYIESTLWSSPTFKVTGRPPWNLRPSERTPAVYKNLSSMQVHKQYPSHMKSCQIFLWKQTPAWRHNFYDYKSGLTRTSMLAVPHYTWLHFFFYRVQLELINMPFATRTRRKCLLAQHLFFFPVRARQMTTYLLYCLCSVCRVITKILGNRGLWT